MFSRDMDSLSEYWQWPTFTASSEHTQESVQVTNGMCLVLSKDTGYNNNGIVGFSRIQNYKLRFRNEILH